MNEKHIQPLGERMQNLENISRRIRILKYQYNNCPYLISSFPRCGRTWVKYFLGYYIAKNYKVKFTQRLEVDRFSFFAKNSYKPCNIPLILFRHDYLSVVGNITWGEYFDIVNKNKLLFEEDMEEQKIIYLFRDPIDVLFSYWPYLQSIPYENFECPKHKNIISFAGEKYWGMDGIINFMNLQLDHHDKHKKKKLIIKYETLKQGNKEWKKIINFIFGKFNEEAFEYAKEQTTWNKLRQENNINVPEKLTFFRKGGSNYITELPKDQQKILLNWPGLAKLNEKIKKNYDLYC